MFAISSLEGIPNYSFLGEKYTYTFWLEFYSNNNFENIFEFIMKYIWNSSIASEVVSRVIKDLKSKIFHGEVL